MPFSFTRWLKNSVPPPSYVKAAGFTGRVDRWQEFEFVAPSSVLQWTGAADVGTGEGGECQITAREVTPSSITTTGGGDPSTGGPLDPGIAREVSSSIVFSPLPPPRMPLKDAPQ